MKLIGALIGGIIGGLIGGAVWAAVAYGLGVKIGLIAWGIGFLVGVGVSLGSSGEAGVAGGVLASIIAVSSILGAKYVVVQLLIHKHVGSQLDISEGDFPPVQNQEYWISSIADDMADAQLESGKIVKWPGGAKPESPEHEAEYPKDIWAAAKKKWSGLGADGQTRMRDEAIASTREAISAVRSEMSSKGFKASFTPFDFVFGFLAIVTAFRVGSIKVNVPGIE